MPTWKPAAPDFRIFWDNAYAIHHLYPDHKAEILNIVTECEKAGNPDIYYELCSTSKVTFPGSGVAALITSPANAAEIKKSMTIQTIGHDKLNQLRHVRFFKDAQGVYAHMDKHAAILRPKFEAVIETLESELGDWRLVHGSNLWADISLLLIRLKDVQNVSLPCVRKQALS